MHSSPAFQPTLLLNLFSYVFLPQAHQISDLIPSHPPVSTSRTYLEPILTAYHKAAYQGLETAIFPHYFHGKCLDASGKEPDGCPNPDCPIVCGTPGSLVHFFPKLRYIAFNQTYHQLQELSTPGNSAYEQVEQAVLAAAKKPPATDDALGLVRRGGDGARTPRRISRVFARGAPPMMTRELPGLSDALALGNVLSLGDPLTSATGSGSDSAGLGGLDIISAVEGLTNLKRAPDVKAGLRTILYQVHSLLEEQCGGDGAEATNGLPHCSWEDAMKEYILTFP